MPINKDLRRPVKVMCEIERTFRASILRDEAVATVRNSAGLPENRRRRRRPGARRQTMHVILGGSVIGTTTAYYLARAGHQVTVVDRQRTGAGDELCQRRRGLARLLAPWAGPASGQGDQVDADAPQPARDQADARRGDVALGRADAAQPHRGAATASTRRAWCLAEYSRDCMVLAAAETASPTTSACRALRCSFRTQKQLDGVGRDIEILQQYGVVYEVLDRAGFRAVEPALAEVEHKFVGALRLPGDGPATASSSRTTSPRWRRPGRRVPPGHLDRGRRRRGAGIAGVRTVRHAFEADAYLAALNSTPRVVAPLGLALPVYPVRASRSGADRRRALRARSRRSWTRRTGSR